MSEVSKDKEKVVEGPAGEEVEQLDQEYTAEKDKQRRKSTEKTVSQSVPPLLLSFHDLTFAIRIKPRHEGNGLRGRFKSAVKERKELLHSVSGHFLPGRLCAIMGPSGTRFRYLPLFYLTNIKCVIS